MASFRVPYPDAYAKDLKAALRAVLDDLEIDHTGWTDSAIGVRATQEIWRVRVIRQRQGEPAITQAVMDAEAAAATAETARLAAVAAQNTAKDADTTAIGSAFDAL